MNKKRNYLIKVVAILLTCILFITGMGIENVSAFWNKGENNDNRRNAVVTMELMHCYHKDTHYDSNGRHIYSESIINEDKDAWLADTKNNPKRKPVNTVSIRPGVLGDTKAGLEYIDTNKYFYEYSLTYAESELVDYVLITQPEITHYSDSNRPTNLREEHVRMYWIGSYNKSMTEVSSKWTENGYDENDTDIGWYDFLHESFPSIDTSLSQQTWETVGDHDAFQNNKSFVFTKTMGENGMEYIYLLEGTKTVNAGDGSFYDITGGIYDYLKNADASTVDKANRRYNNTYTSNGDLNTSANTEYNHRDLSHTGVPLGYGTHVNAVVGIIFYNTVDFDANGGTFDEGSVYRMQTYNNSKQGRLYSWYADRNKRIWYFDIDVSNPQVSTKYGDVSVKAPTRNGYKFSGWYAAKTNDEGKVIKDASGNVELTDIPLYDVNGQAVLNYTDSNGNTQSSPYFDSNGNWIYKGNVTAAAKWEYIGEYSVHYNKGKSNNIVPMPDNGVNTLGQSIEIADGSYISGSDYIVNFDVYTNNGSQPAKVVQSVSGRFPYKHWEIEGKAYVGGNTYLKENAVKDEVVEVTAVYDDYSLKLPSTTSNGYTFAGWYTQYNSDTQTFDGYVGKAGDTLTVPTSENSVSMKLYAKWEKSDMSLAFDYNIPSLAKTSKLGYVITNNDVKSKKAQLGNELGGLPAPTLTGYRLSTSSLSDGWSTKPNKSDGTQVNVPVYSGTIYDGSYNTLYAQWEPVRYTIKYNLNGGSVSNENPVEAGYYNEITIYSPTKNGSTFLGWSITDMDENNHIIDGSQTGTGITSYSGVGATKTSGGGVTPKGSVKVTGLRADSGTVTLTALWQDTQYTIAYDYRDAQSNAALTPVSDPGNPSAYTRNTPTFMLKAPQVKGYYSSPLWGGTEISGKIPSVTIEQGSTGNRRYTAYFSPFEYEIIYDLSGGSWTDNASHPDSAKYNRTFSVSNPVMNGCTFEGWEISGMCDDCVHNIGGASLSGTTASKIKGTTFMNLRCDSAEKVRFTAKWSHVRYSIEYDFNGGSKYNGGSYPSSAETYSSFNITNPVRNGWTFAGWSVSGMDDGIHYLPSGDTSSESVSGVGSGKASGTSLLYGNLRYSKGKVKLTAAWQQDDRQVVFFGNGGTMAGDSVQGDWTIRFIKFGSTDFLARSEYGTNWGTGTPSMSKTGYNFDGYFDALTGGSQAYNSRNSKISGLYWDSQGRWIGPSLILYAHFTPKNFKVTFDANGGYWSSDNTQNYRILGVTYDSTKNNKTYGQTDIYRPGYTFEGWTTNSDGTGYAVYDIDGYNTGEGGYWSENYRK